MSRYGGRAAYERRKQAEAKERHDEIRALRKKGKTYPEIAQRLNLNLSTVKSVLSPKTHVAFMCDRDDAIRIRYLAQAKGLTMSEWFRRTVSRAVRAEWRKARG